LKEQKITTKEIDLDNIVANPWNPNAMPKGTYKKLLSSLKLIGLLSPIVVRYLDKEFVYEIIDGQHRIQALKELGYKKATCVVKECTDDEVKEIIFASGIKGKHDSYKSLEIIEELGKGDNSRLDACNLDKNKLKRLTKYSGISKSKSTKHLKDEIHTDTVEPCTDYKPIFLCPLPQEEYKDLISVLKSIDKDLVLSLIQLKNEYKRLKSV